MQGKHHLLVWTLVLWVLPWVSWGLSCGPVWKRGSSWGPHPGWSQLFSGPPHLLTLLCLLKSFLYMSLITTVWWSAHLLLLQVLASPTSPCLGNLTIITPASHRAFLLSFSVLLNHFENTMWLESKNSSKISLPRFLVLTQNGGSCLDLVGK